MRRIEITGKIVSLAKDYADEMKGVGSSPFGRGKSPQLKLGELESVLRDHDTDIQTQFKSKTKKGKTIKKYHHKHGDKDQRCADYVRLIIAEYPTLNDKKPSEYVVLLRKFDKIISHKDIDKIRIRVNKKVCSFAEMIVDAMRYSTVQSSIFPKYIKLLGFRTCVYCNAQFATTAIVSKEVRDKKGRLKGIKKVTGTYYELDHNMPKSIYPFLCTNFYNLQPCCGSCNRRKNNNPLPFSVYYENGDGTNPRPLHFALKPKDIVDYRINNKCKGIGANLCNAGTDLPPTDRVRTLARKFENTFGIQGVYDEYKDLVEEVLWRHKIYSKGFVKSLDTQMKSLGISSFDFKQYILGTYVDENDAFKRPFTIMLQDIWEQLEGKKADKI